MHRDTEGKWLAESHWTNQQLSQDPVPGFLMVLIPVYPVASKDVYLCEEKGGMQNKSHVKCLETHSSEYIILSTLLTEEVPLKFLF